MTVGLSALLFSTTSYAGGDTKYSTPAQEPFVNVPMEEDKNFYAGLGISASQVNSEIYDKETLAAVTGKVGYNFSEYFALEFRGTAGLREGDFLGHGYSAGIYIKPQYPINEDLSVYGLLGYAQSKITLDKATAIATRVDDYTTQNALSFGLGLDYKLDQDWSLFVDAVHYIDDDTTRPEGKYAIKVNTLTFGVAYHF